MSGYKIGMAEEAVIADLTAKLAECKAQKEAALRIADQHSDVVNNMILQLAESQAREANLREALDEALSCIDGYYRPGLDGAFAISEMPHDDTALKEYRKKVLLEAAEFASTQGDIDFVVWQLRRMAEE